MVVSECLTHLVYNLVLLLLSKKDGVAALALSAELFAHGLDLAQLVVLFAVFVRVAQEREAPREMGHNE